MSLSLLGGGIALRLRELIIVRLRANRLGHCKRYHRIVKSVALSHVSREHSRIGETRRRAATATGICSFNWLRGCVTYQRQVVQYHRKEAPGSIVVDTDGRYVYYVLPEGSAIRYGAIVGEDGQAWSGVATVGRKEEWPGWTPTEGEKRRLGPLPNYVEGGARNPMGSRALYLYAGGKDTLYRIHGTNRPEYIGHAISSGCIRLNNEDVIDLYSRVKTGATVVVLGPKQGLSRVASADSSHSN